MNTFGRKLRLTTFGESHGKAMGGVLDGFPSRFRIDMERVQEEVDRRRPGSGTVGASARNEQDAVEFLAGINDDGISLGSPIAFIIRNQDVRREDYESVRGKFRPNHADYTYFRKYGMLSPSGGGRSSARETVSRVVAGAIARQWLEKKGIFIRAILTAAGEASVGNPIAEIEKYIGSRDIPEISPELMKEILTARTDGDSVGGVVNCIIRGVPAGAGNPVYGKLHARLAEAMMSINAAHGFSYGDPGAAQARGSLFADSMTSLDGDFNATFASNRSGGIQGGISNGQDIYIGVSFKPTPSIAKPLQTVDCYGTRCTITTTGRHDACVAVRAVPVVEAMAALTIADILLEG